MTLAAVCFGQDDSSIPTGYEGRFWLRISHWQTRQTPFVRAGGDVLSTDFDFSEITGKQHPLRWFEFSVPAGQYNRLGFSLFTTNFTGTGAIDKSFEFFGQTFDVDTRLETRMKLQAAKISWDYLSYPAPPDPSRFRFKTLWEIQFLRVGADIRTLDLENEIRKSQAKNLILPTLGAALEARPLSRVELKIQASGMRIPGKGHLLNYQGEMVVTIKRWHPFVGYRSFDARTSQGSDQYFGIKMRGPYFGIEHRFK